VKRWLLLILVAVLLSAGVYVYWFVDKQAWLDTNQVGTTSGSAANHPPAGVPAADQVVSALVQLGRPGLVKEVPAPLRSSRWWDRRVISRLVSWLRTSEVVGPGKAEPFLCRPMGLTLQLTDGSVVQVMGACDCFEQRTPEVVKVHCNRAEGQLIFEPLDGSQPLRLRAPKLYNWLEGGDWRRDVRMVPPDAAFRSQ